ncbi:p-nitrophenyl phosphatase [Tritrichomonas musculus]|uniref:p-nitrophenyl phosphatase n=1 Tax=Tritrichomonas musculus TaxID=1915356 RepID=A0ABR2IR27_9EUKA
MENNPNPIKTVLFDADGCLWVGSKLVPGANEVLNILREDGVNPYIVTNNSNNSREEIVEKLLKKGFSNITKEMIISAGYCTAQYLLSLGFKDPNRKVFVVGESGLIQELKNNGITTLGIDDFPDEDIEELHIDPSILAVVGALDTTLTYKKLAIGCRIVIENDALLIGTNCDNADPVGPGIYVPDALPTILFLEGSTNRKAIVLGKPTKSMFEPLRALKGIEGKETMMVGDRLNTDIKFSKIIGARGTVVLTGITKMEDAQAAPKDNRPDFIAKSVADVPDIVKEINRKASQNQE